MLEGFPERCTDVHRSDIHDGVFVALFYTAIYTCGATFHPHIRLKSEKYAFASKSPHYVLRKSYNFVWITEYDE